MGHVFRQALILTLTTTLLAIPAGAQVPVGEYAQRRAAVAERMGDGVLIALPAAGTEGHPFRYLTGLRQTDAVLVISRDGDRLDEMIFLPARDFQAASWDGATLTPGAASAQLGLVGRDMRELQSVVDELIGRNRAVTVVTPFNPSAPVLSSAAQRLRRLLSEHRDVDVRFLGRAVDESRAIKSDAELDLIRKTVAVTVEAHRDIMRKMRPGLNEFELQALAEYTFLRFGAEGRAFPHIIASGANATILHYRDNDQFIGDGDLVKIDIGALYEGYSADVTRTIPANGRFSPDQRAIYQIVRDAQAAAEAVAQPGAPRTHMTVAANRVLGEGLTRVGLIEAPDATYDCAGPGGAVGECPQLRLFFFHGLGHGIGLNVHDPWPNTLVRGAAFTIEPGIYVRPGLLATLPDTPRNRRMIERIGPAFERYRGIGVRIEDDYIIADDGLEWISRAPREIDEIEALMAEPWTGPSPRRAEMVEWFRQMR